METLTGLWPTLLLLGIAHTNVDDSTIIDDIVTI